MMYASNVVGRELTAEELENAKKMNETKGDAIMTNNTVKFENPFNSKKEAYEHILEEIKNPGYLDNSDYQKEDAILFIEHEIELLHKKAVQSASKKKDNSINEKIAETAVQVLTDFDMPMSLSMMIEVPRLATFIDEKGEEKTMTVQKLNFCIRNNEKIVSKKNRGKMYYMIKK